MPRNTRIVLSTLVLCFAFYATQAFAQQLTAQIKGTVSDATGAAVPDAQVIATNTQTNVSTTVPSKGDGSFNFLQLPVGIYSLTVTKSGFNKFQENNISLSLDQIYNAPVTLSVGSVSTAVEVNAAGAQVETTNTQIGTVVKAATIVDLPLNGRNWVTLEQLAPGVVAGSDRFGTNYATNGSQAQQNSFLEIGRASCRERV